MIKLGTYLVSILFISSWSLNESFADSLGSLESLQKQAADQISKSQSSGEALEGLEYIRGKFFPTDNGNPALWEVSLPASAGEKPRVLVKRPSEIPAEVRVSRWILREEKNAAGVCQAIGNPLLSQFAPSDCLDRNTELTIDESGLAGVEQVEGLLPEEEQQGVVGVLKLSDEEKKEFLSRAEFRPQRLTSGIKSLKIAFKRIIEEGESKLLEVEVAGVTARIRLPDSSEIQYVESGTGRILAVNLSSGSSCQSTTHTEKGCTGFGSASCDTPQSELGKPFHRFCRPPSGALGNYIEVFLKKASLQYFFSSFGQLFKSDSQLSWIERKFISVVPAGEGWAALRSDGAVFRGKDIENLNSFVLDPCLRLERADFLISKEQGEMSCL